MSGEQVGQGVQLAIAPGATSTSSATTKRLTAAQPRRSVSQPRRNSSLSNRPCQCVPYIAPRRTPIPTQSSFCASAELPVMNLITRERAVGAPQGLLLSELDVGVQQAQPVDHPAGRLDPIVDPAAQHLEPAADTEHRLPALRMPRDGVGQPAIAQPREVGGGGLGAGDHDDVRVVDVGRVDGPAHQHSGLAGQRFDVGGVRHAAAGGRGDPQPLGTAWWLWLSDDMSRQYGERILGVQPQVVDEGQHAVGRARGQLFELPKTGSSNAGSPRNLLTMKPATSRWSSGSRTASVPKR